MNPDSNNLSLHFKYFAFIAIMVIIAIATDRWSEKPDFTTYLSNAATMTSLMLGVVAIFYSFISNDSMSRSLGSITTVSVDVRDSRNQIEKFVDLTELATQASSKNTESVREASAKLSTSLADLNETLASISTQNGELQKIFSNLPSRIDQLESKVGDVAKAIGEKPAQTLPPISPTDISDSVFKKFLARAPLSQNLLTYAVVLAGEQKKQLAINEFCKAVDFDLPGSFQGFVACMHAMQICTRRLVEGKEKTYTISNVHPTLIKMTKEYFVDYVSSTYSSLPVEKDRWMARLERVEALYL